MKKLLYSLPLLVALSSGLVYAGPVVVWDGNTKYHKRALECGSPEHEEQFKQALAELLDAIAMNDRTLLTSLGKKYDAKIQRFFLGMVALFVPHILFTTQKNEKEAESKLKMRIESLFDETFGCKGSAQWIERILKTLNAKNKFRKKARRLF